MTKTKFEYCLVVGDQHYYTDDVDDVLDRYADEITTWRINCGTSPMPELLMREIGSTSWTEVFEYVKK